MKPLKTVFIVLISLLILSGTAYLVLIFMSPKQAGIQVRTDPPSSVYINGAMVGKTPYKGTRDAGEITVKVVPDATDKKLLSFETKITLVSGMVTVVTREFGETEEMSSGDVLSFDKLHSKETSLVVVTTPDNAQVSVDGVPRGFAPYKSSVISPSVHQVTIKAPGYADRVMTVNIESGYRLTVFAKLSKAGQANLSPTPGPEATVLKKYVEILSTPTGFLRVRTEPGSAGEEIAEVKPGSKYVLLETDQATGWFKIQYEDPKPGLPKGISGWISNKYSKIVEESSQEATVSGALDS